MAIDFSIVREAVPVLLEGLRVTALVSVIGIPLGILIGIVAAYSAQSRTILRPIALGYVELVRNIPYLILVYLSFFGLPKLGVSASAMAVAVGCTAFYTGGYFCEILRAALRSVARGQTHAALSLGIPLQRIWVVVWSVSGFVALVAGMLWGSRNGVQFALTMTALKALPVLILGGFTSIPGAIVGGLIIGAAEKLAEIYVPQLLQSQFGGNFGGIEGWFPYVFALLFLLVRPEGLFGERHIDRV